MAVQFNGGVVIGADSRTTTGSYIVEYYGFTKKMCMLLTVVLHSLRPTVSQTSSLTFTIAYTAAVRVRLLTLKPSQTSYTTTVNIIRTSMISSFCAFTDTPNHILIKRQQFGEPPSVHSAASIFQKLCYENKDKLSAGIIVAGWDKEEGSSVYSIPVGGGLFKQPWAIGGKFL